MHVTIINISISVENNQYLSVCPLSHGPMNVTRSICYHFANKKGGVVGCLPLDELIALSYFSMHFIGVCTFVIMHSGGWWCVSSVVSNLVVTIVGLHSIAIVNMSPLWYVRFNCSYHWIWERERGHFNPTSIFW